MVAFSNLAHFSGLAVSCRIGKRHVPFSPRSRRPRYNDTTAEYHDGQTYLFFAMVIRFGSIQLYLFYPRNDNAAALHLAAETHLSFPNCLGFYATGVRNAEPPVDHAGASGVPLNWTRWKPAILGHWAKVDGVRAAQPMAAGPTFRRDGCLPLDPSFGLGDLRVSVDFFLFFSSFFSVLLSPFVWSWRP